MSIQSDRPLAASGKAEIGQAAPDFTLPSLTGEPIHLADFFGKKVIVLYFYPKDQTAGCTAEACAFRDSYEIFQEHGAEVIGVSSDSEESHKKFARRNHLPFILLSDKEGIVRKRYGVTQTMGMLPGRVTYVIDRQGIVRHIFSSQFAPQKHVTDALNVLQSLREEG